MMAIDPFNKASRELIKLIHAKSGVKKIFLNLSQLKNGYIFHPARTPWITPQEHNIGEGKLY